MSITVRKLFLSYPLEGKGPKSDRKSEFSYRIFKKIGFFLCGGIAILPGVATPETYSFRTTTSKPTKQALSPGSPGIFFIPPPAGHACAPAP